MTKRDYEKIAKAIREAKVTNQDAREAIAHALSTVFMVDNERFDRRRFLDACDPEAWRV